MNNEKLLLTSMSGAIAAGFIVGACSTIEFSSPESAPNTRNNTVPDMQKPSVTSPSQAPATPAEVSPTSEVTSTPPVEGTDTTEVQKMRSSDPSVYWSQDETYYTSPWFPKFAGQIMIGFGCSEAPYYQPDPSCPEGQGIHHGMDVYLDCGTEIVAGQNASVVSKDIANYPGQAYGKNGLRLQIEDGNSAPMNVIIGHAKNISVSADKPILAGDKIAEVSDDGAPDGCHVHFEVRPQYGSYEQAIDPQAILQLNPVD